MRIALEIVQEIEDRLGWPQSTTIETTTPTAEQRKLLRLMNRVLSAWTGLDDWPLLRKEGDLVLVAREISDLTTNFEQYVTATQNSTVITIDNIVLDDTYKGRALQVSGSNYVYRIVDVPSATTLTLNRAWVDASIDATDEKTFTIAMDRYSLPTDFDRPAGGFQAFFSPYQIRPVSPQEFAQRRRGGQGITVGDPEVYTVFGTNDGETVQLVHFDPYPSDARLLNYFYQREHTRTDSDNDKLFIEERYMEAFIEMVLQLAYRDYEDDAKMQATLADMLRTFNQQRANPGEVEGLPTMRPRNLTRSDIRRAARSHSMRLDYGSYFDNINNTGL